MFVNLAVFGSGQGERRMQFDGDSATLREILEKGNAIPDNEERSDIVVNGEVVTDLETPVADGATVTKTPRVKGG